MPKIETNERSLVEVPVLENDPNEEEKLIKDGFNVKDISNLKDKIENFVAEHKLDYPILFKPNSAGFGKGIHNCLEAAVYNIPIIFGPNYHKFQEAKDFISLGIAKSVNNPNEFRNAISNFEKLDIKQISADYFKNKIGGAEIITQHI